jgi:hypothetical protein
MTTFVVVESGSNEPLSVNAKSAQEAADQVVGSGPYSWSKLPRNWKRAKSVKVRSSDLDGNTFSVRVYGPF